ncbi:MAG: hypothetical protein QNI99_05265 [Woeseiaceae bacterium]|nr:hypothetical protein [Woeseiaceae bacterium]
MNTTKILALVAALGLCACQAEIVQPEMPEQTEADVQQELDARMAEALAYLERNEGNWVRRGGALVCEGYMTRYADEDYCASEVPDDWRPFELNGEIYYVQPLALD